KEETAEKRIREWNAVRVNAAYLARHVTRALVAVHPLIAFWRNEAKFLSDSNRSNGIREQIPSLDFLPN
ncbi:MAG: hypothetical protein WAV38_12310, partial [Xanthobacteraceae bacterium]